MIVIEDAIHAEQDGDFASFDEAVAELRRRATIPWDQPPNVAPCMSWRTCGREYYIVQFDVAASPWKQVRSDHVLDVSASGVQWAPGFTGASVASGGG